MRAFYVSSCSQYRKPMGSRYSTRYIGSPNSSTIPVSMTISSSSFPPNTVGISGSYRVSSQSSSSYSSSSLRVMVGRLMRRTGCSARRGPTGLRLDGRFPDRYFIHACPSWSRKGTPQIGRPLNHTTTVDYLSAKGDVPNWTSPGRRAEDNNRGRPQLGVPRSTVCGAGSSSRCPKRPPEGDLCRLTCGMIGNLTPGMPGLLRGPPRGFAQKGGRISPSPEFTPFLIGYRLGLIPASTSQARPAYIDEYPVLIHRFRGPQFRGFSGHLLHVSFHTAVAKREAEASLLSLDVRRPGSLRTVRA
jgi:hypothetical protein